MRKFFDFRDIKWPGAWLIENDLPTAVPEIPNNRTLFVQQFTDEPPSDVVFVEDCQSVQDVFGKFKPGKTVEMINEEGISEEQNLEFRSLMDFGRQGITKQSDLLNRLSSTRDLHQNFMRKLTDEQLNILLADPEQKQAYIDMLKSLIDELDAADPEGA